MAKKEKTILFVKREFIFLDFWIFKKLNRLYWWFILHLIIKTIKRHCKENIIIISDLRNQILLQNRGIECKIFGEYAGNSKAMYPKAIGMINNWFNSSFLKDTLKYEEFNLGFIEGEEFSHWLYPLLGYFDIINTIFEKEKPEKVIIAGKEDPINRFIYLRAKKGGVSTEEFAGFWSRIRWMIEIFVKRYSLAVRFHNIPILNRTEFARTKKAIEYKKKKRNILLMGLDDTQFNRLGSVPYELIKDKNTGICVLCSEVTLERFLEKKDIPYFSFGDFLDSAIIKKVSHRKNKLINSWRELSKLSEFREIFNYGGISLLEVIGDEFSYLFYIRFPWILYYIETIKKLLKTNHIDAVVSMGDAGAITRSAALIAKSMNIPSLVIQNGVVGTTTGEQFFPMLADKMAVWGAIPKKTLTQQGGNADRIVITGNPQLSTRIRKEVVEDEFYKKLGVDKNKEIFIFATQAFGDFFAEKEIKNLFGILLPIFKKFPEKQLIINVHLRDDPEIYESIVKGYNLKNVIITKYVDLNKLLNICDILITVSSTIASEIMFLDKPVVITNFFNRDCAVPYAESGATIGVKNKKELYEVITDISKSRIDKEMGEKRAKFVYESFYKRDGRAGKRIIAVIKKLIRQRRKKTYGAIEPSFIKFKN